MKKKTPTKAESLKEIFEFMFAVEIAQLNQIAYVAGCDGAALIKAFRAAMDRTARRRNR